MGSKRGFLLFLFVLMTSSASAFPIAEPRIGGAPGVRDLVRLAASDEQFLVVWKDTRGTTPRTFATRMTRGGVVVDPVGFALDDAGAFEYEPGFFLSAASDGRDFLVAIERSGALRFVKVTREGAITAAAAPGFHSQYGGKLVWLGDAYAYFFDGQYGVVDRDGRVLLTPRTIVSSSVPVSDTTFTVAPDGTIGLLSWIDSNDDRVYAAVVTVAAVRGGTARVSAMPAPDRNASHPLGLSVAASGSRFFLTWSESGTLLARVLDRNGAAVGAKFTIASGVDPSVAWNGSRFVVAFAKLAAPDAVLGVSEYSEDGTLVATPLRPETAARRPQVAALGGDTLVAWNPYTTTGDRKEEVRADILGTPGFLRPAEGILVSKSAPRYRWPDAVWRGDHYLAAWTEFSDGYGVGIGRFDAQGRLLDGPGQFIPGAVLPSVATDGNGALVAVGGALQLIHVAHDGTMTVTPIAGHNGRADVTWTGREYAFCAPKLIGTVSADGQTMATADRESIGGNCDITWTGTQYAVLWSESESCFPRCNPPTRIYAQAFSRNFSPIGAPALLTGPNVDDFADTPYRTASAGDRTLVVWRTYAGELRGARIAHPGTLLDPADGFAIGDAAMLSSVHVEGDHWIVHSGPYTWTVGRDATVGPRVRKYPFVDESAEVIAVTGGPAPLLIHQTLPGAAEQTHRLAGHFDISPKRRTTRP